VCPEGEEKGEEKSLFHRVVEPSCDI